jgi:hypothetical protein
VTVSDSSLWEAGFSILVGAQTSDNKNKEKHLRMDRTTATYPIVGKDTVIANPLGGGIYIMVPYKTNFGQVHGAILLGQVTELGLLVRERYWGSHLLLV